MTRMLLLLLALVSAAVAAKGQIPLEDLAKYSQFRGLQISPDGRYFAAKVERDDGSLGLVVLKRGKQLEVLSVMNFEDKDSVGGIYWANNERLLMEVARYHGTNTRPSPTGELYGMNADGSKRVMLFGYRAKREKMFAGANIIHFLPEDDDHVLISTQPFGKKDAFYPTVYKLNVNSGRLRKVTKAPVRGTAVIADHEGNARFAIGNDLNDNNKTVIVYRDQNGEDWRELASFFANEGGFTPIAFMADNKRVVGFESDGKGPRGIAIFDPTTGKRESIFSHPQVDVSPLFSIKNGYADQVVGASYELDYPEIAFFEDNAYVQDLKDLQQAFPGHQVTATSVTRDGKQMVVAVSSDVKAPTFYLFDREKKQVAFLINSRPWLKAEMLAQTKPISYQARDGQTIHGLLTLPKGKAKDLPLVLHPHGGPHGIRDHWGLDTRVQMLANNGYAVLQPNFRGSGGYGTAFQEAGHHNWGTLMIDDMTDGVKHLIKEGIVDAERVCTYGISYGGYSAIMSAMREPDLYKCAIGDAGVYDLKLLSDEPGAYAGRGSQNFRDTVLGTDEAKLKAQSPAHNVHRLKAAVMLVHGGKDRIAPIEHAEALKAAMDKAGYPYQWHYEENEGHGYFVPENKVKLWKRMLAFLDKHIGH
ncbi:S9 family peptidase [Gallaecimonas sp. GXIMD4217]|uniref:S9 family peptidase n=1 Tax=Gallaecimonas sp. GXIMD4217 TaxID=3131927 RepID=UPI00311ABE9A